MTHARKKRSLLAWTGLHVLESVAFVLAVAVALVMVLCWRLAQAPLDVAMLRPGVERVIAWTTGAETVDTQALYLRWAADTQSLDLRTEGLSARDHRGREILAARRLDVGLSFPALLRARLALGRFEADRLVAALTLSKEGKLKLGYWSEGPPRKLNPDVISDVVLGLIGPEDRDRPLSFLRVMRLQQAGVLFMAPAYGVQWQARAPQLALNRGADGVHLVGAAAVSARGHAPAHVGVNVRTQPGRPDARLDLTVSGARPAALLPGLGVLKYPARVDAPIDAVVRIENKSLETLSVATVDLNVGAGRLALPGGGYAALQGGHLTAALDAKTGAVRLSGHAAGARLTAALTGAVRPVFAAKGGIQRMDVRLNSAGPMTLGIFNPSDVPARVPGWAVVGAYQPGERRFDIHGVVLRFGAGQLAGRGHWTLGHGSGDAHFAGRLIGAVAARDLLQFWPATRFPNSRLWMTQALKAGVVENAAIVMTLPPRVFADHTLQSEDVAIRFGYQGGTFAVLKDVLPIRNARGQCTVTGRSLDLTLADGQWGEARLSKGHLTIPRFGDPSQNMTLNAHAEGTVADIMRTLNGGVLRLADRAQLQPARLGGQAAVDFTLSRPLRKGVTAQDLKYSYDVRLGHALIRNVVMGYDAVMSAGRLIGDQQGLAVEGSGVFGPIRGQLSLRMPFAPSTARRDMRITGVVDADTLRTAPLPVDVQVRGSVPATLQTVHAGGRLVDGRIVLDAGNAALTLPYDIWRKPAGQPLGLSARFASGADGGVQVSAAEASGGGVLATASAAFGRDGRILRINAPQIKLPNAADISLRGTRSGDGRALMLEVEGAFLDARPFIAMGLNPMAHSGSGKAPGLLAVNAQVQRARVAEGVDWQNVTLGLTSGAHLQRLNVRAASADGKPWLLDITPDSAGKRVITAKAADAGLATRILTGMTQVNGGTAEATGSWSADGVMTLDIHAKGIRVRQVPALATLLSVASIGGLGNALSGEGLVFNDVRAPLVISGNTVKVGAARATGPGLGVTTSGHINTAAKTLALDGSIAPAYGVNAVLGNIPLLGNVLVSRKGEGVVGFTYTLEGPIAKPRAFVNPLSAFAPGVFRRLFEGGAGRAADDSEAAPKNDKPKPVSGNPSKR
jgi:hypothetical protein